MKVLAVALLALCLPAIALSQTPAPTKPAVKPVVKPARASGLAPSAQKAVEERTPIEDEPMHELSPAELLVARAVFVGTMRCELGASVTVTAGRREGFFIITTKTVRFRMHPAESRTGAVRLEDPKRGAMWLQLGNKSMLMSQKLGQRLADECQSPEQIEVAEALKKNPQPSILDAPATPK